MAAYSELPTDKADIACPYCRSTDTDLFSLFGQQLLTMQYYCNTCHTPFEYIKDDHVLHQEAADHVAASAHMEPHS